MLNSIASVYVLVILVGISPRFALTPGKGLHASVHLPAFYVQLPDATLEFAQQGRYHPGEPNHLLVEHLGDEVQDIVD